jgi:hypothetical protein
MHKQLTVVAFLGILALCPARSAFAQLTVPDSAPAAAPAAGAPAPAAPGAQVSNDAQTPITRTPCGSSVAAPFALPPPGSPPFVWILQPCFNSQGGSSTIENETYMYYIQLRTSQTRQNQFVWYDAATEQLMLSDFKRLWATNFLDDLSIEVTDYTFPNGTVGKIVTYNLVERERVKIVD